VPQTSRLQSRKRWIAFSSPPKARYMSMRAPGGPCAKTARACCLRDYPCEGDLTPARSLGSATWTDGICPRHCRIRLRWTSRHGVEAG
jgi:hypothetical protein